MPLSPRLTETTGVRVGAGVGSGVGDSVVGAGEGTAVGAGVGGVVGAAAHVVPTHQPVPQSSATAHAAPMPQAGQYAPPQSTSVSPCAVSSTSFVHSATVGTG